MYLILLEPMIIKLASVCNKQTRHVLKANNYPNNQPIIKFRQHLKKKTIWNCLPVLIYTYMIEMCGSWINQTLNSDLDVWYFVWALFHHHELLQDLRSWRSSLGWNKAQTKYHTSKSELSVWFTQLSHISISLLDLHQNLSFQLNKRKLLLNVLKFLSWGGSLFGWAVWC